MKKKIGDLTINQAKEIKSRCQNYDNCKECKEKDKSCYKVCEVNFAFDKDILDQEIEVEEDER